MAIDIIMPQLSDTMKSGKILSWKKQKGDTITRGDILAEVETEKANLEIEAFHSGVLLEIVIPAGADAEVGKPIAIIGKAGESITGSPPASAATPPAQPEIKSKSPAVTSVPSAPPVSPSLVHDADRVKASPLAKKIAEQNRVDLSIVTGSGPNGRIVKRDVEGALQAVPAKPADAVTPSAPRQTSTGPVSGRMIPLTKMRETIARRMQESVVENPHFYVTTSVNMGEALRLREVLKKKPEFSAVTINHMILKAVAYGLANEPRVNRSFRDHQIFEPDGINLGVITAIDDGLLIPVIREADKLSLKDLAFETKAAIDRARAGRPTAADLSGGTFSVSNMGMFDVDNFTAIINPGQGGIIAISSVKETPIVQDGAIVIGQMMKVTVSVDHRVIDGVMAAKFLQAFKEGLENPALLM